MSINRGLFDVPPDYSEMLLNFTITVLRTQPSDIVQFAIDYFSYHKSHGESAASQTTMKHFCKAAKRGQSLPTASLSHKGGGRPGAGTSKTPDDRDDEMETSPPPRNARRQSVAAARYNPEDDSDDSEGKRVVHPKSDEQRKRLNSVCKDILLFKSVDEEDMGVVVDAMFKVDVKPNHKVITQGEEGDNFYVIEKGVYDAFIDGNKVFTYDNKGSFGELALMYSCPRAATVVSKTDGCLWAMDRDSFRKIVLKSAFKKRAMFENLLNSVPLLKELSAGERMRIADSLLSKTYQPGDKIISQGEEGLEMYFVETGQIKLMRHDDNTGADKQISMLKEGSYFGELALVTRNPRAASAVAITKCKVASLDRESFERLLGPCLDIMKRNISNYEKQLQELFKD